MKIYAIIGLPGSGRHKLAQEIAKNKTCEVLTEIGDLYKHTSASSVILIDILLIESSSRESLERTALMMGAKIRYIFFENAPEKCYHESHSQYHMNRLSALYSIPEGYEVRSIESQSL